MSEFESPENIFLLLKRELGVGPRDSYAERSLERRATRDSSFLSYPAPSRWSVSFVWLLVARSICSAHICSETSL